MLRLITAAFAALVLAFGAAPAPASAQPKSEGELTIALSSLASETLDPMLGGQIVKFYLDQIFDYLVGCSADGTLSKDNGLARDWEVSADKTRWTFVLRSGVTFHDGSPLTSEDVKFSILRNIGKRSITGYAGPLRELIKDIETPAPDKVVVVTKQPTLIIASYLSRALSSEGMVLSKKYLEAKGDDGFLSHPIGTGPYKFVQRTAGSFLKLEAVDKHWRQGTPRYKTMWFRLVPEETTRIAMLRQGKADMIDVSRERVKEIEKDGFPVVLRKDDAEIIFWFIENYKGKPLDDKRVREAINMAIDRQELAETIFNGMASPNPIPFGMSWSYPEVGFKQTDDMPYKFDPKAAKKLLADAGFGSGLELQLYSYRLPGLSEGQAMAEAIAGYWEAIGIKTKLVPVDYPAFRKAWVERSAPGAIGYYNVANRNWIGAYAIIDKYGNPAENTATMHDPELETILKAIPGQTEEAKVHDLMRKMYARLRSESLGIGLVNVHTPYAVSKKLAGWNPGTVMYDLNLDQLTAGATN
jgi:peptide/nickel transport system substrate-binding protein